MPKKIELKLKINGKEVCVIPVEIPGTKVEALTSTYAITKEIKFSRDEFNEQKRLEREKVTRAYIEKQRDELAKLEEENRKLIEEQKKPGGATPGAVAQPNQPSPQNAAAAEPPKPVDLIKDFKKSKRDIKGYIYFKSEWKGEGSEMPPVISLEQEMKRERHPEKASHIKKSKLIDINDPRFESIVKTKKDNNEHLK